MADVKENDHETSTKRKKRQRITTTILKNEDRISRLQYEEGKFCSVVCVYLMWSPVKPYFASSDDLIFNFNHSILDYAEGYLSKLSKELDETLFAEVLSAIVKIENNASNVKEQFEKVEIILKDREDLQWEFLGFLEPYQALECGKLMSYYETCSMKQFVRNLMVRTCLRHWYVFGFGVNRCYENHCVSVQSHFKRQPHLLKRIIDKLCYLAEHESVQHDMVEEGIAPLLQKNSVLMQQFLKLLPAERPPEWYKRFFSIRRIKLSYLPHIDNQCFFQVFLFG